MSPRRKTVAEIARDALSGTNVPISDRFRDDISDASKPPPGTALVGVEGNEIAILDSLMPSLHPKAQKGEAQAVDQVVKVLELRLKYRRQARAEEDDDDV